MAPEARTGESHDLLVSRRKSVGRRVTYAALSAPPRWGGHSPIGRVEGLLALSFMLLAQCTLKCVPGWPHPADDGRPMRN